MRGKNINRIYEKLAGKLSSTIKAIPAPRGGVPLPHLEDT